MITNSIYSPAPDISNSGMRDKIAIYGVELRKCDDLLAMGWVFSNGQHIGSRAEWLSKEIVRLEDQVKESRANSQLEGAFRVALAHAFSSRSK